MEYFIKYLERKIEACDELGGLEREKAVYQSVLKDYKKAINVIHCCESDSEQLKCEHKYGQLKDGVYTCFDCGHKEEW